MDKKNNIIVSIINTFEMLNIIFKLQFTFFKLTHRVDSDEIKEMQIRTTTSCLYATAQFLNSLPAEHVENIESELKSMLLTNSTYWKLNKHPTPSVCFII